MIPDIIDVSSLIHPAATGGRLRDVRLAAGLSQSAFASFAHLSTETVTRLEIGNVPLSSTKITTQAKIARALKQLGIRLTATGWEKLEPSP